MVTIAACGCSLSSPSSPGRRTALVAALNTEWAALRVRPDSDGVVRRWATAEVALAGTSCLADVEGRVDGPDADAALAGLLRLAHAGDQLAARTLLQLNLGAAVNLGWRTRHHAGGELEEAISRAIACLWEAIAEYPLPRRRGNHATGLALEVLHRLTAHTDNRPGRTPRQPAFVEVPVAHEDLLQELARESEPAPGPDTAVQIDHLLSWALRRQVLSADEVGLLRRLHLDTEFDQIGLARQLGISPGALRQRSSRAIRRLAEAVRQTRVPAVGQKEHVPSSAA